MYGTATGLKLSNILEAIRCSFSLFYLPFFSFAQFLPLFILFLALMYQRAKITKTGQIIMLSMIGIVTLAGFAAKKIITTRLRKVGTM